LAEQCTQPALDVADNFLKHLGEPTEPPPLAAARAPPYWQARELRHRPQAQTELFDA
jgi:hypothetical protein